MRSFVTTAESVTAGHPDKICDQVSDAVVDAYLSAGIRSGVIAECALATGVLFLSVRSAADAPADLAELARRVVADAGYGDGPGDGPAVMLDLSRAPAPPAPARAGHMVTAFGHACDHGATRMPYPIWAAHRLTRALDDARRDAALPWILPDAQAQVAVAFDDRAPVAVPAVALTFAAPDPPPDDAMRAALMTHIVTPAFAGASPAPGPDLRLVIAAGRGAAGPQAHSGLTGRKGADDAYGAYVRRGGAALSGKDPSRIDRIAAYAARQAALCVLAAGLARECEVQLSYIIGDQGPVTVEIDSFGSGALPDAAISARLREAFDFRVGAIAERMDLWALPGLRGGRFYRDLAAYGHMGRADLSPPWEDTGPADRLA